MKLAFASRLSPRLLGAALAAALFALPGCVSPRPAAVSSPDTGSGQDATSGQDVSAGQDVFSGQDAAVSADGGLGSEAVEPADIAAPPDATTDVTGDVIPGCQGAPPLVATSQEGTSVIPQTALHLGTDATCMGVQAAFYSWSVKAPAGSVSLFRPSSTTPAPTYEVNLAGTYRFRVDALDAGGAVLASSPELVVEVTPQVPIHVELVWDTPGDPDQTDEGPNAGADLDLHFIHPGTYDGPDLDGDGNPDPYFEAQWDTYWFNPSPPWAGGDPALDHSPSLDRDDTDGGGPENLNLANPEDLDYVIAVHSWDDHGFGESIATVRVYIYGALTWESAPTTLQEHDLWRVGTLSWPGGAMTPSTLITPNYCAPYFGCQ